MPPGAPLTSPVGGGEGLGLAPSFTQISFVVVPLFPGRRGPPCYLFPSSFRPLFYSVSVPRAVRWRGAASRRRAVSALSLSHRSRLEFVCCYYGCTSVRTLAAIVFISMLFYYPWLSSSSSSPLPVVSSFLFWVSLTLLYIGSLAPCLVFLVALVYMVIAVFVFSSVCAFRKQWLSMTSASRLSLISSSFAAKVIRARENYGAKHISVAKIRRPRGVGK